MTWVAVGATGLTAAIQVGKGVSQKIQTKKLKPSNFIPESIKAGINNAKQRAGATEAPGAARNMERTRTATANAIDRQKRVVTDAAQLQQQVGAAQAQENEAIKDQGAINESYKFNNYQDLQKWLGVRGQYEQGNQDAYNAAKSALKGASSQNIFNGVSQAGAAATALFGSEKLSNSTTSPGSGASQIIGKSAGDLDAILKTHSGDFTPEEIKYLSQMGKMPKTTGLATPGTPSEWLNINNGMQ